VRYLLYKREQMFQRADAATRQHQRLVRVIGCNDLANVSLMNGPGDRRFMKALAEASKVRTRSVRSPSASIGKAGVSAHGGGYPPPLQSYTLHTTPC